MAVIGQAEILLTANTARFTTEMDRARATSRNTATDISRGFANMASESQRNASLITRSFNQMANVANDLKNTLAGVVIGGGIMAGLDKIKTVSDAMKSLDTQVKLVTASEAEYLAVRQQVRGIADYVHNDINATALLYTNSARALGNMGKSQADVLKFTKAVSLAMAIGGKSANEQAAAILQLGQAMQSGVVQGDEFRSISENAPVLLDLVAKSLNKTRGEVRAMSSDGKITADVMYNALAGAIPKLEADYAKIPATMAGAWQVVKNKTAEGVGDFMNQTGGISDTIANQMLGLADGIGATFNFIRENGETIKGVINTTIGVVAVTAFAKLGTSALATVPSLTAQSVAMVNNARMAVANATSQARLGNVLMAIVQGHTPVQMALYRYTQATAAAITATANFTRNLPANVAALRTQATQAMANARSMDVMAVAQRAAASGGVLAARGVMGIGSALGGLASIINRHPLLAIAGVLATVLIGTEGLQGAMKSLSETVGVTGVIFENMAKGAVEGISFLAKDAVAFFNSFGDNSKKSTATANGAFGRMFNHTEKGLLGIMQVSASIFDKIGSHVRATALYGVQIFGNMFTAVHNGFVHMGNGITSVFEMIANAGIASVNFVLGGINQLIAGINRLPANFGGGQAIAPITLIAEVKFKRGETLAYDNASYSDILKGSETTALRDVLDRNIEQYRMQQKASQQATGAMVDLTKATQGQAAKAKEDEDKEGKKKQSNLIKGEIADAIQWAAADLKIRPNDLAAVISFETGGTFSPAKKNPGTTATGLIQMTEANFKQWGFTRNQFAALSANEQMKYVVQYLKGRGIGQGSGLGDIYDAVAGWGYKKGTKAYELNRVWDVNKNGVVERGEAVKGKLFQSHIKNYFPNGINLQEVGKVETDLAKNQAALDKAREDYLASIATGEDKLNAQLNKAIADLPSKGFSGNALEDEKKRLTEETEFDRLLFRETNRQKLDELMGVHKTKKQQILDESTLQSLTIAADESKSREQRKSEMEALDQGTKEKIRLNDIANKYELGKIWAFRKTSSELIADEWDEKIDALRQYTGEYKEEWRKAYEEQRKTALENDKLVNQQKLLDINVANLTEIDLIMKRAELEQKILDNTPNISTEMYNAQSASILRKQSNDVFDTREESANNYLAMINGFHGLGKTYEANKAAEDNKRANFGILDIALQNGILSSEAQQKGIKEYELYLERVKDINERFKLDTQITLIGGYQSIFGGMSNILKMFGGENRKSYMALLAIQKGYVVQAAFLNNKKAISDAWATDGNYFTKAIAVGKVVLQNQEIMSAITSFSPKGFMDGGYTDRKSVV